MISGIFGVVSAFLFVLVISIGIEVISKWGLEKKSIEGTLLFKAIFVAVCSIASLRINLRYFLLDAVAKAGLTIAVLLVASLPVLMILKRKKQKAYENIIHKINRYIL